mmetsp:Transcript_27879/g.59038  ORF Transcript_27879/g.59038 Transcript_27879/m.59038 type:complete len:423 (+) Transcript_27879:77-1345(+)
MDLLKAEIERKRRAVAQATNSSSLSPSEKKRKRYLKASELRALEERQLEEHEDEERRRKKNKKKKRRSGDEWDESDEGEEEDLQTLLTKKYEVGGMKLKTKQTDSFSKGTDFGGIRSRDDSNRSKSDWNRNESAQSNGDSAIHTSDGSSIPNSLKLMSYDEVTRALRSFGLPIRLFGEASDDFARLTRLHAAMQGREAAIIGESEKDEFALGSGHGTRNIFLERGDDEEEHDIPQKKRQLELDNEKEVTASANIKNNSQEEAVDPPKKIYRYFKSLIRQWEDTLAQRPESQRRTAAGKNETKTLKQCKDYIRPLFHLCKSRQLEPDLQTHLFNIVTYCEQGEFVKAHDAYMDVAIGRAAWPIGVTMVGIHARSGRAKIESSNVAHVMNSEMHRKYLTSVKRLMSFAQKMRPDVDPSKKVMNL